MFASRPADWPLSIGHRPELGAGRAGDDFSRNGFETRAFAQLEQLAKVVRALRLRMLFLQAHFERLQCLTQPGVLGSARTGDRNIRSSRCESRRRGRSPRAAPSANVPNGIAWSSGTPVVELTCADIRMT
jgi:hypothetical protein